MRRILIRIATIGLAVFAIGFLLITYLIEKKVQDVCKNAVNIYPGDKIEAVIQMAKREDLSNDEKVSVLWAIGQLGDRKALKFLKEEYDENVESYICNYEAKLAIRKLEEDRFNLPAFMWRGLLAEE